MYLFFCPFNTSMRFPQSFEMMCTFLSLTFVLLIFRLTIFSNDSLQNYINDFSSLFLESTLLFAVTTVCAASFTQVGPSIVKTLKGQRRSALSFQQKFPLIFILKFENLSFDIWIVFYRRRGHCFGPRDPNYGSEHELGNICSTILVPIVHSTSVR